MKLTITRTDHLHDDVYAFHGEMSRNGKTDSWGCMIKAKTASHAKEVFRKKMEDRYIRKFGTKSVALKAAFLAKRSIRKVLTFVAMVAVIGAALLILQAYGIVPMGDYLKGEICSTLSKHTGKIFC